MFTDSSAIAGYADKTRRKVPGYSDLHRMAAHLLSERAGKDAHILVLGAGGGLELKAFAEARPDWSFLGVDPSQPMLDMAVQVLGPLKSRVELKKGFVEDAPAGPFDGATSLLLLHFLPALERLRVLRELRTRLRPGAPLIVAHHCNPGPGPVEDWLARSVGYAAEPQAEISGIRTSAANMAENLTLLSPPEEEALLRDAGFSDPALFYAALSFRGWVAYAKET